MTILDFVLIVIAVAAVSWATVVAVRRHRTRVPPPSPSARRILFPFAAHALSRRALDAALRLARVDGATLVPVYLAQVPLQVPLDAPLPRQCSEGLPLLETIEQRATLAGVAVDSRLERGRTLRHALHEAIEHERYDRLVVAAASRHSTGFHGDDIAWLLDRAPGELVIIRPDSDDTLSVPERRFRRGVHEEQPLVAA
jgi:nucleotide-binding universal stress UspA family protein